MTEIKLTFNLEEAKEVLRGLKLCDKYPLPMTADMDFFKRELEAEIKEAKE